MLAPSPSQHLESEIRAPGNPQKRFRPHESDSRDALVKLESLPLAIGWGMSAQPQSNANDKPVSDRAFYLMWVTRILGWLITAIASLFGAPFWYDALQSFVRIKGAGPSPAEKKTGAGAAA